MEQENNMSVATNSIPTTNQGLIFTTSQTSTHVNNIPSNQTTGNDKDMHSQWNWRNRLLFILWIIVWVAWVIWYNTRTSYNNEEIISDTKAETNDTEKEINDSITYYQNLSDKWHENQTSWLYYFTSKGSYNGESTYWLQSVEWDDFDYEGYVNWDEDSLLYMYANYWEAKIKDNPWIEWLYDFRSFIYLNLSFSWSTLLDWNIVDKKTEEWIGKLTVDELNKKYNYDATHEVQKLDIEKGDIKLSELKENEIYQYTVQEGDYITPKFINDLNKTAILYKKSDFLDSDSLKYDSEIIFAGKSQGWWMWYTSKEYKYNIYYKLASTEEVLQEIWEDDIIYLSKYNVWEEISFRWEEIEQENWGVLRIWSMGDYMYNDTDKPLTVKILDEHFGELKEHDITEIQPWEIYERYWSADAFIISNEKIEKYSNNTSNEIRQYYEDEETKDFDIYSEWKAVQARIRDINRKNDLAQVQVAIITSQQDRWMRPGLESNIWNDWFSGADKWAKIKDISKKLYSAWMSSIPRDPNNEILAYWLWAEYRTKDLAENNWAKWDYLYLVSTRNSIKWGWFVLMAKTETEEWSNWVVCKDEQWLDKWYIKRGTDLKDITICYKIIKWDTCSSNADTCTYTDEEELRYILLY